MNKAILYIGILVLFNCFYVLANESIEFIKPPKPGYQEQKEFDRMLDDRLKLTDEQKKYIKTQRPKHIKDMEKRILEMEHLHKKIKEVYMLGLPKYQADIKTASMKDELAILKQNADKQKLENRKNFENILTKEQKIEFEKIKKELELKRQNIR